MSEELFNILNSVASALAVILSLHSKKRVENYKKGADERHQSLEQLIASFKALTASETEKAEKARDAATDAAFPDSSASTAAAAVAHVRRVSRKVKDMPMSAPAKPEAAKAPARSRRKPAKETP